MYIIDDGINILRFNKVPEGCINIVKDMCDKAQQQFNVRAHWASHLKSVLH